MTFSDVVLPVPFLVSSFDLHSGRAKRETAKGRNRIRNAHFRRFLQIFADFRLSPQETADFRRKPQKTADFCRNRFLPFAVSLLARSFSPIPQEKRQKNCPHPWPSSDFYRNLQPPQGRNLTECLRRQGTEAAAISPCFFFFCVGGVLRGNTIRGNRPERF